MDRDLDVQVAMTHSAQRFVTPLTFRALTGRPVLTSLWSESQEIEHVERGYDADVLLMAPASANLIARLANGLADDVLTTTALSSQAPLLIAPAMETNMWLHPATRANVSTLKSRGVVVIEPTSGALASGRSGLGRFPETQDIVQATLAALGTRSSWSGVVLLVTAGPTFEPLDPVRGLTNRSTGAMGIAIADAAHARGAEVHLVLGPTALSPRSGVHLYRVETAAQMLVASEAIVDRADVIVASAAVSDFRPASPSAQKVKKTSAGADTLPLELNPDILTALAARRRAAPGGARATIVGFAAETSALEKHAKAKLAQKGCDFVVANLVGPDRGFGPQETEVLLVSKQGPSEPHGPARKAEVAEFLLDRLRPKEDKRS
jgi:phosphopantothenoylcysteine decarboxylase/phosphopantothenate--cysteine ligase